jgi:hypothetical protein
VIVSELRLAANRRNAQLSTGPRTEQGKMSSRANSLKHGLCASVVVVEDVELVQRRSLEFFETLKPQNELHVWLVGEAALCSIRIERAERIERRVRDKISLRAELTWDDDRRFEVEVTGRSLSKDPGGTVESLRRTPHGCDWLMARWAMLAYSADVQQGSWTDDQTKIAFDLLATPHAFRNVGKPGASIDFEGRLIDSADDSAAVARREVKALKERREVVADLDEVDRIQASSDLINEGDPELRRLRRYESTLFSRMKWCLKQITIQSPYRCSERSLRPNWVVDPEAVPEPKPERPEVVQPPLPLELLDGSEPKLPEYLTPGQLKQIRMEESRRAVMGKKPAKRTA